MKEMISKRINWIDVARGMAILLVVMGHCIGDLDNPGNRFILSFHMPLFFFLSGLCAKVPTTKFFPYLKRKSKALLVPQLTLGFINCVFDFLLGERRIDIFLSEFFYWFLLVLFYVVILFYFLCKLDFEKKMVRYIVILTDFILVVVLSLMKITTKIHIEIVPMALLFYLSGYFTKSINVNIYTNKKYILIKYIWIFSIPIIVICSYWNTPVTMYVNTYGNLLLFFITAVCGIVMICNLAKGLQNNKFLSWIGKNSVIIYVLHFKVIDILHILGKKLLPKFDKLKYSYPVYWYYFVGCILVLLPSVYICNRWLGSFFGKKK